MRIVRTPKMVYNLGMTLMTDFMRMLQMKEIKIIPMLKGC
jgi:hypothetical protein